MLLVVDLPAGAILLVICLRVLLPGELAAVTCAVGANLFIDTLFAVLVAGCLAGCHLVVADAVGNAVLLPLLALAHFTVAVVRLRGIVLVLVDGVAQVVF